MSESGKPSKRPPKSARPRARARDPRVDTSPPPREEAPLRRIPHSIPSKANESAGARIAALELEISRLRETHAADADGVAEMLVRVADLERERATAQEKADRCEREVIQARLRVEESEARIAELTQNLEERAWEPTAREQLEQHQADLIRARGRIVELESTLDNSQATLRKLDADVRRAEARAKAADDERAGAAKWLEEANARAESLAGHTRELEAAFTSSEQERNTAERRSVELEAALADATETLEHTRAQLATERERSGDLDSKLLTAIREHAEAVDALRREHSGLLEAMMRDHQQALAALERHHDEAATTVRRQHETALADLRGEHATATAAAQGEHARTIAALETRHDGAMEAATAKHAAEIEEQRRTHTEVTLETRRAAALAVEEERSAAARARQQTTVVEAALMATRESMAKAAALLDELERREEMAAGLRARTVEQARSALGDGVPAAPPSTPPSTPTRASTERDGEPPTLADADVEAID
jgi:hypothetical protein